MKQGAFVNEDSLYLDLPVSCTVIVDTPSTMLAIDRHNMKLMETQHPKLALEIQRTVLRHTASTRNKLERELDSVNHWQTHQKAARQKQVDEQVSRNSRNNHTAGQKARSALSKWVNKTSFAGTEDPNWDMRSTDINGSSMSPRSRGNRFAARSCHYELLLLFIHFGPLVLFLLRALPVASVIVTFDSCICMLPFSYGPLGMSSPDSCISILPFSQ